MFILICGWRNGLNLGIMIVLMYLLYRKDCIGEWFGLWDEIIILMFMGFKSYLGRVLESLCNYRKMYD